MLINIVKIFWCKMRCRERGGCLEQSISFPGESHTSSAFQCTHILAMQGRPYVREKGSVRFLVTVFVFVFVTFFFVFVLCSTPPGVSQTVCKSVGTRELPLRSLLAHCICTCICFHLYLSLYLKVFLYLQYTIGGQRDRL